MLRAPSIRPPGTLFVIGLCFAGSALARAADPDGLMATADVPPPPPAAACAAAEPGSLLAAIRERETQLEARATALADRARLLEASEARFRRQTEALKEAEARLAATLAIADQAADKDVERLVAVYEAMKPKTAAQIFQTMEPGFAAGFLARMKPGAAASILAGLTPDRAYAISAVIAGRNARAPTE